MHDLKEKVHSRALVLYWEGVKWNKYTCKSIKTLRLSVIQRWSIVFLSLLFKLWAVRATKVSASLVEKGAEKSQCSSLSASMFLTVTVQNGKNNKNKQAVMGIQGAYFSMGSIQTPSLTFPQHYTEKETWGAHLRLKSPFSKEILMCIECLRALNLETKKRAARWEKTTN